MYSLMADVTYIHSCKCVHSSGLSDLVTSQGRHSQSSSYFLTFPGISNRGINKLLPPEVHRYAHTVLLNEYCGTIGRASCACQLYLTILRLCLFCDYRNCGSTPQANHNFPGFSLTNVKFPDLFRFSK